MSRWTVRSDTSSRSPATRAGRRPCVWSSSRIDRRRSARMPGVSRKTMTAGGMVSPAGCPPTQGDPMAEPHADRPHIPGYGIPTTRKGTLPWSWARDRLERAIVYWLATAGADGGAAPHPDLGRMGRRSLVRGGWPGALAAQPAPEPAAGHPRRVRRRGRHGRGNGHGAGRSGIAARRRASWPGTPSTRPPPTTRPTPRTGRRAGSGSCSRSGRSPGRVLGKDATRYRF